jgi:hypothetical protein
MRRVRMSIIFHMIRVIIHEILNVYRFIGSIVAIFLPPATGVDSAQDSFCSSLGENPGLTAMVVAGPLPSFVLPNGLLLPYLY